MERERTPIHRPTLVMMILLIVMLIIGIVVRWGFIREEVTDTVNRYIGTEEVEKQPGE